MCGLALRAHRLPNSIAWRLRIQHHLFPVPRSLFFDARLHSELQDASKLAQLPYTI